MDKRKKRIVGCVLILVLCLTASPASSQETIRIATGEYPPLLGENLSDHGIGGHLVSEAYATMGIRVRYGYFPWIRAKHYMESNSNEWDASGVWFKNEERVKVFHFSEPVLDMNMVFFHLRSKTFDWDTLADLRGLKIGAVSSATGGDQFDSWEKEKKLKVTRGDEDIQLFKMLLRGRIDVTLANSIFGRFLLRENLTPEETALVTFHPKPLFSKPLHLIFSKENPKTQYWLDAFDKVKMN